MNITHALVAGSLAFAITGCASMLGDEISAPALVDAFDPPNILEITRAEGYQADLTFDEGRPVIKGNWDGYVFDLTFYACDKDENTGTITGRCEIITFVSGIDIETPLITDAMLSTWNSQKYGAAFLDDEGDPFLSLDVNMLHGVSRENFVDTLNWFVSMLPEFETFMAPVPVGEEAT